MRKPRFLSRGLVFGGIGAALLLGWNGATDGTVHGIGWVLAAVGVAHLLYYVLEGRKERDPRPPQGSVGDGASPGT